MKFKLSSGQASKVIIIVAAVVFLLIILIYGGIMLFGKKSQTTQQTKTQQVPEKPKPVYEATIGNVRFVLESSTDLGRVIPSKTQFESDYTTTERFIKIVIGAQNKGKNNISDRSWDIGNIVDSEGRNFASINDKLYSILPRPDLCGALLKPEFDPLPCIKYYEVSKISRDMKIEVKVTGGKAQSSFLNLKLP